MSYLIVACSKGLVRGPMGWALTFLVGGYLLLHFVGWILSNKK